jgi:hypothetical protein
MNLSISKPQSDRRQIVSGSEEMLVMKEKKQSILQRPKTGYVQHTNPQHPNTDIRPETRAQKEIGMGKGGFSGFNYWQVYNELVWLTHTK